MYKEEEVVTRTVRKSDYTPALALPKHKAGIFDEKCRVKEKYREEQIGECPFSIPRHNLSFKLVPLLSTPCGTTGKDYCYDGCHWITY